MTLFNRNGRFYVQYGKKRVSLHIDDEKMAKSIYAHLVRQIVSQKLHLSVHSKPLLQPRKKAKKQILISGAFDDYIKMMELKGVTKDTINFKINCYRKLVDCNIKYFSDFTQENVNNFVQAISKYSVDTQRKYVTEFFAFLNNSVKKGYIKERIVKSFDLPKTRSKARELIIEEKDWEQILAAAKSKDLNFYYYLLTVFNTFSRPGEVLTLKASDFNLNQRYVDVFQNKTKKNKRVYLYEDFCKEIADFLKSKGDDYLFDGHDKQRMFCYNKFKVIRTELNLNEKYTLYTIRHTSVTYLMNKTSDVEFVARQAGDTPEIVLKHYINRNDAHYLELMNKK